MSAVQPLLPLPGLLRLGCGAFVGPFTPSKNAGPYRLPHDVWDRLVSALAPARNRDAALALAVFLGRFWSTPSRITSAFPIDRRELADRPDLGLTEAQVRGAIRALEAAGFLDRALPGKGSHHRLTEVGELHRKPVLFQFGSDYASSFSLANKRAQKARERHSQDRRIIGPGASDRARMGLLKAPALSSPKNKSSEASKVLMGELKPRPPAPVKAQLQPRSGPGSLEKGCRRAGAAPARPMKFVAQAGVCRRMVQNALREAARLGLLTVEEHRREGRRNLPNVDPGKDLIQKFTQTVRSCRAPPRMSR